MINRARKVTDKIQGLRFLSGLCLVFIFALIFVADVSAAYTSIKSSEVGDQHWLTIQTDRDAGASKIVHRQYAQSSKRSKSDVIKEVKGRYKGAKILRIKLDSSGAQYKVRVLLPSGKVRNVSVSVQK